MYEKIRNASLRTLIDFNINSLPVTLSNITDKLGIKILNNSDVNVLVTGEYGATIKFSNSCYIVVDDIYDVSVRRFVIAHELGHILLGHIATSNAKYCTIKNRNPQEQEADIFAICLLTPERVLQAIRAITSEQIAQICNIPLTIAQACAGHMRAWEVQNKYYLYPLEWQVRQQFSDFIQSQIQKI